MLGINIAMEMSKVIHRNLDIRQVESILSDLSDEDLGFYGIPIDWKTQNHLNSIFYASEDLQKKITKAIRAMIIDNEELADDIFKDSNSACDISGNTIWWQDEEKQDFDVELKSVRVINNDHTISE